MATPQEFYIRAATENEARGPFNAEQLVTLAENGQIDAATLYYDAVTEQWVAFGSSPEVMTLVFPEKKKLKMGKKEIKTVNDEGDSAPPISVEDILAASEGLSSDTKGKQAIAIDQGRAAKIGLWAALFALLLSAAALGAPSFDLILALDFVTLVQQQPLALLGLLDLGLAVMLGLGAISLYPFLRFRATLGLGLIGFLLLMMPTAQTVPLVAVVAGSVGLYFCTVCVSFMGVGLAALAAIGGMAGFAWFSFHH